MKLKWFGCEEGLAYYFIRHVGGGGGGGRSLQASVTFHVVQHI